MASDLVERNSLVELAAIALMQSDRRPAEAAEHGRQINKARVKSVDLRGKWLRVEFSVAPQAADSALASSGLLVINPPWTLQNELKIILPELEKPLGQGGAGRFRLETPKA